MVRALRAAGLLSVLAALMLAGVGGQATAAPVAGSDHRYYQAAVNLVDPETPGADGLVGAVSFTAVVGGSTSVNVYLSRALTVACPDGGEDFATLTLRTQTDEATTPGPVTLQIDRRLNTAVGVAVVDLVQESAPGCGEEPRETVLAGQDVRIEVEATTVRFRTGMESRVSAGADAGLLSSVDYSRDGVGSASVGSFVRQASSSAAFLKFAVDRTRARGTTVDLPPNAAPAGGFGAVGAFTRTEEANDGPVFEDLFVTATVGGAPSRNEWVEVFALRSRQVACPSGEVGDVVEFVEGGGPAEVDIDARLNRATASGTLEATRTTVDGCTGAFTEARAPVPVSLSLDAVGPVVRSVDTRFQVRPGEGVSRERLTYSARAASGTATVADLTGPTDLAAISRAGR